VQPANRVMILTEDWGGGHIAASNSIEVILKLENFEVLTYKPLTNHRGNQLYNKFQQNNEWLKTNWLTMLQIPFEWLASYLPINYNLKEKIRTFSPELIISVLPVANSMTFSIAKSMKIPMLVIPTDLEMRHFFHGFNNPDTSFKIGLAFDDEELINPVRKNFGNENFIVTGFPLRSEFSIPSLEIQPDMDAIRSAIGAENRDKIAILMMGAQGCGQIISNYISKIVQNLPELPEGNLHIMALCGKNENLLESSRKAASNKPKPSVLVHALGFKSARYIAALMRTADVIITKPGGSTVNEAIASELFTLFHAPKHLSKWEKGNMEYVERKGWGERIQPFSFLSQLTAALNRKRVQIPQVPGRQFKDRLLSNVKNMIDRNKLSHRGQ
jgi:processive 1,2-diacylglycerol beta-glucosyltransferase